MKLTNALNHAKRFWWGKGWGPKPRINTDNFYYRMIWKAKRRRPLEIIKQTLPEGCQPIDPNLYVKNAINTEFYVQKPFILPWPYSKRPIKNSRDDPNYREQSVLIYHRYKRIIEPINLPLYFTNSILMPSLPEPLIRHRESVTLENEFIDYSKRRIEWCLHNDSALRKLPKAKEFPYLDQNPPRVWGAVKNRKENHLLQTLFDLSNQWYSKSFGFPTNLLLQRVQYPNCVHQIERDHQSALLELKCDFISLITLMDSSIDPSGVWQQKQFDLNYQMNSKKALQSIYPISWKVGFDSTNFYPEPFDLVLPNRSKIQTIFLSNNDLRELTDEDYQGRAIMFCHSYAMQQARSLPLPLTIQCLYTNPKEFKIGFVLFQLNTTDNEDGAMKNDQVRNQVWFSTSRSIEEDTTQALLDVMTIQSFQMPKI
ncbi:hypothetical protein SSS_07189 [Sarcoptes scabiei]|uniref:39S ribosomal protein L37, mitochondrial-like protein n=1 Tax=Sarcoptes scabiei TaxID=52283 RepID=A0A834QZU6_SARSC|nr:hypothetical protein SSS_07189 [Sarcoptes scabiei]UXI16774.1 putative phospholipid-transporting ATPase IIB [Sarcoptes scabiei]